MARKGIRATQVLATEEQFSARIRPGMLAVYNGKIESVGSDYAIGLAWSVDGVDWARDARNPMVEKGAAGAWDDDHVKDPKLVIVDEVLYLYYAGYDGTKYQIGLATSKDYGQTWTKYGNGPVLPVGAAGAFDDAQTRFPVVAYDADAAAAERWKMWYAGEGTAEQADIGYATSSDGKTWTKQGAVLSRGGAGAWDAYTIHPGHAVRVEDVWHLFYQGKDASAGKWQGGHATSTDLATYTKNASNPTLQRRSTAIQALTADLAQGGTTVSVADSSVFSVDEYVLVDDDDSAPTFTRIASIESATQITIRDGAVAAYTTLQNAKVTSIYSGSVDFHSLWREGNQWVASITAFQMTPHLREYGGFARANALDGVWEFDIPRGVTLEPEPQKSGWDYHSVENFSMVPLRFAPWQKVAEWAEVGEQSDNAGAREIAFRGDIVAAGGFRQQIDGFYKEDVGAGVTAAALGRWPTGAFSAQWIPARSGSVTALVVKSSASVTAGTITVEVYRTNPATATGFTVVLDVNNPSGNTAYAEKGTHAFTAGESLHVRYTTSAGFSPTTADITVTMEVET